MYAKVTIAQSHPDAVKSGEAGKIYRDSILPETKQLRGYKGTVLLTDQATGKGITVTLFESAADLKASEESGHYDRQMGKLAHLLITPHVYEAYEVVVHDIEGKTTTTIARGTFGQLQAGTGKQEEAIKLFRDAVMPELKQHAGFQAAFFMIDRATGKAMSLSMWTTEANLKANEQSGHYHQQLAKLGHLFSGPAVRELFEATFHNLS